MTCAQSSSIDGCDVDNDDESCIEREPLPVRATKGSFDRSGLDRVSEDILGRILSLLDTKERLRARFVCKAWASAVHSTGWERVNLRFIPDPPRDGLRDERTLYKRADARGRWLSQQNPLMVRQLHVSPLLLCGREGCQVSQEVRPKFMLMANTLKVLEVRLVPGERAEYALPFERLEVLTHLHNLEHLSVQLTTEAGANILEPFCSFQNLHVLEIHSTDGQGAARVPPNFTQLQKLERLSIENISEYEDPMNVCSHLPKLRCIELKQTRRISSDFTSQTLERLRIDHDGHENQLYLHRVPIKTCPKLKELVYSPLYTLHAKEQLKTYSSLVALETNYFIGSPTLQELTGLVSLRKLRVDLQGGLNPPVVKLACGLSNLTNLEVLSIRNMANIEGFEVLPALRVLNLAFSLRVKSCAAVIGSDSLEILELGLTQHPDACTVTVPPFFAKICHCPRLHTIIVNRQERRKGDIASHRMHCQAGFGPMQIDLAGTPPPSDDVAAYGEREWPEFVAQPYGPPLLEPAGAVLLPVN
eukprot:jgi/Botrbrau1/3272/Bobra.174_1s0040.1